MIFINFKSNWFF